jgi:SAM-dependent methyltransferase
MDEITREVRAQYELYPYPHKDIELRTYAIVLHLLSMLKMPPPAGRELCALDAGCGRGVAINACAEYQPHVRLIGADINRIGLEFAREQAKSRGLKNVEFHEVDLMTLEGLEVPEGGFDVIWSSGVLHHLSDPAAGLRNLKSVLAPHGVMVIMVYGKYGRQMLYRAVAALDILIPRERPIPERLAVGHMLAHAMKDGPIKTGPAPCTEGIPDVEFVDRYLNVNETSYDVTGLFELLDAGGMRFLRWCDQDAWDTDIVFKDDRELRAIAARLPEIERYRLIEQIAWHSRLMFLACRPENGPRPLPAREELEDTVFIVNPEMGIRVDKRVLNKIIIYEKIECTVSYGEPYLPPKGPLAKAATTLSDQNAPFNGLSLVEYLGTQGVSRDEALDAISEFLQREFIIVSTVP